MTTRLNVNLNDECANALKAYSASNDISVTEAVRRSISLLCQMDVQEQLGNKLAVVDGDGSLLQVWGFL